MNRQQKSLLGFIVLLTSCAQLNTISPRFMYTSPYSIEETLEGYKYVTDLKYVKYGEIKSDYANVTRDGRIKIVKELDLAGNYEAYNHEVGHLIDYSKGVPWEDTKAHLGWIRN